MQETSEKAVGRKKLMGRDPLLLLIKTSIVIAGFWTAVVTDAILGFVLGIWYFIVVLWFFKKTKGRWKWETGASVVIGLVCYYELFWSWAADVRDAQAGIMFVFGSFWAGMAALLGDVGVALLSFLIRASIKGNREEE